jgi:hypothetical protein
VVLSLQIGNEIDGYGYAAEPTTFWSDYGVFLDNQTRHVHAAYPGVQTGFTGTFHGLVQAGTLRDLGVWRALARVVDVVGITYYPQSLDFAVRDPRAPHADFAAMVAEFPNASRIFLQEVGYQTSATCNSTPAKQAAFFCNVFAAWDAHADRIGAINIVRLRDLSTAQASVEARAYSLATPAFLAFLETLGLTSFVAAGDAKPAVDVIQRSARLRGWDEAAASAAAMPQCVTSAATATLAPPSSITSTPAAAGPAAGPVSTTAQQTPSPTSALAGPSSPSSSASAPRCLVNAVSWVAVCVLLVWPAATL